MPSVRVYVPSFLWTVTTVTRESLLRPSVSISRYVASSLKWPNILQCCDLGMRSARAEESPSFRSSAACMTIGSDLSLRAGFIHPMLSAERKSSHERISDSQRAISFVAPTDGSIWNVCSIIELGNGKSL